MFRVYLSMTLGTLALVGLAFFGIAAGLLLPDNVTRGVLALVGAGGCVLLLWDSAKELEQAEQMMSLT